MPFLLSCEHLHQYRCMNVIRYLPDPHISGPSKDTLPSVWKLPLPDSSTYYQPVLRQYFEQTFLVPYWQGSVAEITGTATEMRSEQK